MSQEEKIIKQIISKSLGVEEEELHPEADLEKDLNAQSLEIAEMLLKLEKQFSVEISDEEKRAAQTVQDIINSVLDNLP